VRSGHFVAVADCLRAPGADGAGHKLLDDRER